MVMDTGLRLASHLVVAGISMVVVAIMAVEVTSTEEAAAVTEVDAGRADP